MDDKQSQVVESLQKSVEKEKKIRTIMVVTGSILTFLAILCFLNNALLAMGILLAIPAAVIWYVIYLCRGSVERMENDLHIAQNDIKGWEKLQKDRAFGASVAARQAQAINAVQHPSCPMCGSHNTQRISTASRAISVAAVGLASAKIGKQYECKNCKHKW